MHRDRLIAPLLTGQVGLVEAGAGYGKSVLAWQYREALGVAAAFVPLGAPDRDAAVLVSSLRRALLNANLSDLASATDVAEPAAWVERLLDALAEYETGILLVLDDAHHLSGADSAALVLRLARGIASHHRLLIAARSLAGSLRPIRDLPGAVRLDTSALTFTSTEAAELVERRLGYQPSPYRARLLVEATGGWATALMLAAERPGVAESSDGADDDPDLIGSPLRAILGSLAPDDRRALVQLAHVPVISPELCDRVSGSESTFERFVDAGVPLARTETEWWEMPGPVAEFLAAQDPLEGVTAAAAADIYQRHGELLPAVRVLCAAGLYPEAADAIARMPPHRVEQLGVAVVSDLLRLLPPAAVAGQPRVLLHLARVAETAHQGDLRAETLARAAELATKDDPRLRREVDAELARDLIWDERRRPAARALAEAVIAGAAEDEIVARSRALDVLGRLSSWFSTDGPQPAAERLLEEAAALARGLDQRTWAAQALVPLAMGFHCALCRFDRALQVLDEALADLPSRSRYRALVQTFRADTLVEVGRFAEAEACIAEMRQIGRACREPWVLAYASWSEAGLASYRGDAERTIRAVHDVELHRDDWYEQASGVEFLAQASDFLSRVGEDSLALTYHQRARERMAGCERPVRFHGAAVLARSGPPDDAEVAIAEVLAGSALDPHERWPLLLLRAHVAVRSCTPDAGMRAAEAFETCRSLGHAEGPLIREPAISPPLLTLAAGVGSRAATTLARSGGSYSIRTLGGFAVTRAGQPVSIPAGRPTTAVRAVVAAGGRLHAEQMIEILWPGADLATGRNRLRNLLSRLRGTAGALLTRDGEMIALGVPADVDLVRFEEHADSALRAHVAGDQRRALILGRAALECYGGELLPDDRYADWVIGPRERLRGRFLQVLDALAQIAEQRGETDEAARLLDQAILAESHDERRYLRLARLLLSQGRAGSAIAVIRRAQLAMQELELELSSEAKELERLLDARSSPTGTTGSNQPAATV